MGPRVLSRDPLRRIPRRDFVVGLGNKRTPVFARVMLSQLYDM